MTLYSQLQEFNSKYQEQSQALLKVSIGVLSIPNLIQISIDLLQEFKYINYIKEQVIRVRSLSSIEVVPSFSLGPSKHVKHIVLFSTLLITVPIYLSVYKVLLLLISRVYTIIKLIQVFDFIRGVIGATSRVVVVVVP